VEESKPQVSTIVSVRMDVVDLATISYIYDQLQVEYTSRSNLLGIAIHQYVSILKDVFEGDGKRSVDFENTQQAVDYVQLHKRLKVKEVKVGKQAFQEQLKQSVRIKLSELDPSIRAQELLKETEESVDEVGIPEHLQERKEE